MVLFTRARTHVHMCMYTIQRYWYDLIHYKAFRVACGSARYARSQGRMERNDRCIGMWSYILGAKGRLVNAQSSMLQENNPDATCMYVYTKYKVPLREVARGVAQERNEKHPA